MKKPPNGGPWIYSMKNFANTKELCATAAAQLPRQI
jgi:hypothetical protein